MLEDSELATPTTYNQDALLSHFIDERLRTRQHSLNEVSELILHDLMNPLAVLKFCLDQLETNPQLFNDKPQYIEKLRTNLDRVFGLIEKFRQVVKPELTEDWSRFDNCHRSVIKLIRAQLKDSLEATSTSPLSANPLAVNTVTENSLHVEVEPSLEGIELMMPHFETVFLLDTLYRYVLNLSGAKPTAPKAPLSLAVKREDSSDDFLILEISSNANRNTIGNKNASDLLQLINLEALFKRSLAYGVQLENLKNMNTDGKGTKLRIVLPIRNKGD